MQLSTSTPSASADSSLLGIPGPIAGARSPKSPGCAEDSPVFDFAELLPSEDSAANPIQGSAMGHSEGLGRASKITAPQVATDARAFTGSAVLLSFPPAGSAPVSGPAIPTEATTNGDSNVAAALAGNGSLVSDLLAGSRGIPQEGSGRRFFSTESSTTALQTEGLTPSEVADSSPLLNQGRARLQTAKSGSASSATDDRLSAEAMLALVPLAQPPWLLSTAAPSGAVRQQSLEGDSASVVALPAGTAAMSPGRAQLYQPSSRLAGEMLAGSDQTSADFSDNTEDVGVAPSANNAARALLFHSSGAATAMATIPAKPRTAEGLPIGQEARDDAGIPLGAIFAGSDMLRVDSQIPRAETRLNKLQTAVIDGFKSDAGEVGTSVAKSSLVMTSIVNSNADAPGEPWSSDHGPGLSSVGASAMPVISNQSNADRASTPAETLASAHRAVDAVLATAERFTPSTQSVANLKLSVGDSELMIRVEVRAGEVHATFRTDSPELRAALSHEWRAVSLQSVDQSLRLAAPVFASSEHSFGDQNSGFSSEHPGQGREQPSRFKSEFVLPGSLRDPEAATADGGDAAAAMPALRVQSPTTQHLHAFA
jgi:hypothetical protein